MRRERLDQRRNLWEEWQHMSSDGFKKDLEKISRPYRENGADAIPSIYTVRKFDPIRLRLESKSPFMPGQQTKNKPGSIFLELYLKSFNLRTVPAGECFAGFGSA